MGQAHVFGRSCHADLPVIDRGEGVYLFDQAGKRYLDACGGAAVSCLGHSDPDVKAAIAAQMDKVPFAHTGFFTSDEAARLADLLVDLAPGDLSHVYFVSGGSEAVEAAVKLARQYAVETGQGQRTKLIARLQSYHGNTLGALAAGGNLWRREAYNPLLIETSHIPAAYPYRGQGPGESLEDYGQRVANALEAQIEAEGPETVLAFLAEPVVGATLGAQPAPLGYFKRIREICDKYGVLLILDEVMCGSGRTGSFFAHEQEGISPDICTIAKGMGAGYQPVGAMLCTGRIFDAIANGSGFFQHGHTYIAHPMAMAAARATVEAMVERNLMPQVRQTGARFADALTERFGQHPHIGDIRGRGLFWGMEFVENRETKAPFDPARKLNKKVKAAAMAEGLMCYPMGGTIDGRQGDHVLFAPPYIFTDAHIDEAVEKFARAFESALAK
ncbi:aspartate aminotransferase family protein [Paracoccaceae bacterium GXU_MW_L88]